MLHRGRKLPHYLMLIVCLIATLMVASTVISAFAQPACDATPIIVGSSFPEIQGVSEKAELWALIFQRPPLHADYEVKIVWRMTNVEGSIEIIAEDTYGISVSPVWGPEEHNSSNWQRPGREWGTGFVFPHAGCWTVKLKGDSASGEVKFAVQPAFLWF